MIFSIINNSIHQNKKSIINFEIAEIIYDKNDKLNLTINPTKRNLEFSILKYSIDLLVPNIKYTYILCFKNDSTMIFKYIR